MNLSTRRDQMTRSLEREIYLKELALERVEKDRAMIADRLQVLLLRRHNHYKGAA